jgi:peptidoglycan/LPS O-acetylase OafA/YrhL
MRAFSGFGKMSYTVYLMHLPLVAIVSPHIALLRLRNTALSAWLSVGLTLPMMVLFYYLFERRYAGAPARERKATPAPEPAAVVPEPEAVLVGD